MKPAGITRVRNESLIIADTIEHFLGYCDQIILYDDCSQDETVEIARQAGGDRLHIIHGDRWRVDRQGENTRHRHILHKHAQSIGAEWCLCFDADERLVGELPKLQGDGFTFRLFDGYMTPLLGAPCISGLPLDTLARMWGPEYRDILMLFRTSAAAYAGTGRREPKLKGVIAEAPIMVKHYGKCLSVEHWEETCDYYMTGFPASFRNRWAVRKGKAIHVKSDFDRPLFTWNDLMVNEAAWVKI